MKSNRLFVLVVFAIVSSGLAMAATDKPDAKANSGAAAGSGDGAQTFSLAPQQKIMRSLVSYYRPMRIALSEKVPEGLKAEPKYLSKKPLYGTITLGAGAHNQFTVVVDEAEGEKPKIYIDRNHDGDLTNDGSGEWGESSIMISTLPDVSIDVPYESGPVPYTFNFYRIKNPSREAVLYYRNACRTGEVELAGNKYKIAVLDDNSDGRFDDLENGALLIDLDQDGKLEGETDSAEYYKLNEPFNIEGKVWEAASMSPDGLRITLRQSKVDVAVKPYLKPGRPAPMFTAKGLDDTAIDLKGEASRGKYVLLDFWASWCGPCRREFPTMRRIQAQYKEHGLRIVGIDLDQEHDAAMKAAEDASLDYPHAFDGKGWKNAVAVLYRVHAIPQTYLLDSDLKIVAKNLRGEALQQRLRELLGPGDEAAAAALDKEEKEKADAKAKSTPAKAK